MTGVQEADEGTRTRLKRVAARTAAANEATADAMTQTAGIGSVAYPTPNLWETHRELIDAYYELRRAIDVVEKTIDDLDPESRGGTPRRARTSTPTDSKSSTTAPC